MINTMRTSLQALSTLFFPENHGTTPVFHKAGLGPPLPNTQDGWSQQPQNAYGFVLRTTRKLVLASADIGLALDRLKADHDTVDSG
jgi:hypothetical protein